MPYKIRKTFYIKTISDEKEKIHMKNFKTFSQLQ